MVANTGTLSVRCADCDEFPEWVLDNGSVTFMCACGTCQPEYLRMN